MSENIIIAIIAFLGGIATTYLGWALNQKRIKKFKKASNYQSLKNLLLMKRNM